MGKGMRRARLDVSIILDTFGGMGSVVAKVKMADGKKVASGVVPMTQFPGAARGPEHVPLHIVGKYDAEESFKDISNDMIQWILRHARW